MVPPGTTSPPSRTSRISPTAGSPAASPAAISTGSYSRIPPSAA
jgi:hypothetical protein